MIRNGGGGYPGLIMTRPLVLAVAATLAIGLAGVGRGETPVRGGTRVRVKLLQFISSETSQPGDTVRFEVAEDVALEGIVVIRRGTPAVGTVVEARAYRLSRWPLLWWDGPSPGRLVFTVSETVSVDGDPIRLRGPLEPINRPMPAPLLRWHHEGELFDTQVDGSSPAP